MFSEFPGIGPRQAKRFVYFLLRKNNNFSENLTESIKELKKHVKICKKSFSYFYSDNERETLSPIERDVSRDNKKLMIVEKDSDLENIEKSGVYSGHYFVLGGTVPILEKEPDKFVRSKELVSRIEKDEEIKEVILALSANPDGENTMEYVESVIKPILEKKDISLSHLGKGLSTGTELEYSDKETIKSALENRY